MNKDYEQKNDALFHSAGLRGRIAAALKPGRYEGEEMKQPQAKSLPIIPVTGKGGEHKYLSNKHQGNETKD
jgi:hypothetical protein